MGKTLNCHLKSVILFRVFYCDVYYRSEMAQVTLSRNIYGTPTAERTKKSMTFAINWALSLDGRKYINTEFRWGKTRSKKINWHNLDLSATDCARTGVKSRNSFQTESYDWLWHRWFGLFGYLQERIRNLENGNAVYGAVLADLAKTTATCQANLRHGDGEVQNHSRDRADKFSENTHCNSHHVILLFVTL